MIALVKAEFLKVRTTQVWFWLLLAAMAVSGLLVVGGIASQQSLAGDDVPNLFASSATGYVVTFVLGVLGVTTEFRYQTITPTVLITPSRWVVVTAKMITYAVLGVLYAAAAVIVQLAIALPWLSSRGVDVDFGDGDVQRAIIGVFAVLALFGIIGLGVGALLRNQIVAVVVGIVFLLVLQPIIGAVPGIKHVFPYLPAGALNAILISGDRDFNGVTLLPVWGGVVALLLWAFVPAILGSALTLTRDIT
ncbi:hypothetical protein [Jatrophihabitans fulvus]